MEGKVTIMELQTQGFAFLLPNNISSGENCYGMTCKCKKTHKCYMYHQTVGHWPLFLALNIKCMYFYACSCLLTLCTVLYEEIKSPRSNFCQYLL